MRTRSFFLPIIFLFLHNLSPAQDVTGKWSGIMTVEQWWEGITGPWHKRFDMTIQNNVVTGTMNGESKLIIGDQLLGEATSAGTGTGELWRLAFNADGTYDLEIISHPYSITGYNKLENDGKTYTSNGNQDGLDVHSWPIPPNRNLLTGKIDTSGENPGLGKFRKYVSWTLINGPLNAVLIVTPTDYNNWMPKPGQDDNMHGNAMAVNLKVQGLNGGAASLKAVKFEIRLTGTSSEPGTTINYPINSLFKDLPDLRLLPVVDAENLGEGQNMEMECLDGATGRFFIGSYDGGGWSDLKVVAILEGGIHIEGHLLNHAGVTTIPIPKRKPGSHIADAWLQANGNPGELDDNDESKGNLNKGDGLSAYEEYRGVWTLSQHQRLNPKKKELGIFTKNRNVAGFFTEGINWFKAASGVDVVQFTEGEIDTDRRLNKNARTSTIYEQYVLKLDTGQTSKSAAGENRPISLDFMLPKQSDEVVINISYMNSFYPRQAAVNPNARMPYTLNELIASTVAHEIAHGVNVNHHGDPSRNVIPERVIWERQGDFHVFNEMPVPQEIPVSQWPFDQVLQLHHYKIFGETGERTPGNEESGDMSCFMCYTSKYNWSYVTGSNGSFNYYMVPLNPVGKKLCTSAAPTGINLKPWFFGPAKTNRGNCLGQIQLK